MSDTVINLVVILILIGTIALALFTYLTNKKRKSGSQANEQIFKSGLLAQHFSPDHLSWFGGTGMATKQGDNRLALYSKGNIQLYPFSDIVAISTSQTTANARPLGAAPGVVEIKTFQLFNIDISLKNVATPIRILVANEDLMHQWEQRLKASAGI